MPKGLSEGFFLPSADPGTPFRVFGVFALVYNLSMTEYKRAYPSFSLCGLRCCLCPRFNTEGSSKCPGCGGPDFSEKHPSCGVISCAKRHGGVEFCGQCTDYPCERYLSNEKDSFIPYVNVQRDFEDLASREDEFKLELELRRLTLELLLERYNEGRSKAFYCLAMNLLPIESVRLIRDFASGEGMTAEDAGIRARGMKARIELEAKSRGVDLKLRS
jgi:hypothetical protein